MYRYALKNRNTLYKLYVDHRFQLNGNLKAVAEWTWPNISPKHIPIVKLPSNFMPMERSISMLNKLLAKFFPR